MISPAGGAETDWLHQQITRISAHYASLGLGDVLYDRVQRLTDDLAPVRESLGRLDDAKQAVELRSLLHAGGVAGGEA